VHRLHIAVELGPGVGVVEAGVEELTRAQRRIAGLAEEPRQRHPFGVLLDDGGAVAQHMGLARQVPGKERRPRRIA
jgi:hypothetical protein